MKEFLGFILVLGSIGIVFLLCFFCCFMAGKIDNYWEELKREMEKKNERR